MQVTCPNCQAKSYYMSEKDNISDDEAKIKCKCGSVFSVKEGTRPSKPFAYSGETDQRYDAFWKKFFNLLTWIFGLLFLVISVIHLIEWPRIIESYIFSAICISISIIIFLPNAFNLGKKLSHKLNTGRRLILVLLLICFMPLFNRTIDNKKNDIMLPEERTRTIIQMKQESELESLEQEARLRRKRELIYLEQTKMRPILSKMKIIQEEAYQDGQSCQRHDTLNSCSDFLESYKKQSEMLLKLNGYLKENSNDQDCQQVVLNSNNIQNIAELLLKSEEKRRGR